MEAVVAVTVTAAMMVPVVVGPLRDAEHAFDGSDRTAHARAYGAADHATYRAPQAMALVSPLLRAADDALSTRELRQGQPGDGEDKQGERSENIGKPLR